MYLIFRNLARGARKFYIAENFADENFDRKISATRPTMSEYCRFNVVIKVYIRI